MTAPGSMPTLASRRAITVYFDEGTNYGYSEDLYVPARRHLYLRYVVAFPSDFDFGPSGGFKMPGIGERVAGGVMPHGCDADRRSWSGRLQADCLGSRALLCGYVYWAKQPSNSDNHWVEHTSSGGAPCGSILRPRSGKLLQAGKWHVVEVESIRNTPGLSDGIYRVWLDGVKIVEDIDARMTESPMHESAAILQFYFGGTNRSPKAQSLTVRDFILKGADV